MKKYNIFNGYLWRISGGRYPTLYFLQCKNENPLKVIKEVRIPVPPYFARGDITEYLEEAEKIINHP